MRATDKSEEASRIGEGSPPGVMEAKNLKADGLWHGFFQRTGGVSKGIYASLNCGRGSKDEKACIEENRSRVAAQLGLPSSRLVGPYQIHSPRALIVDAPWPPEDSPQGDALVTNTPSLAIAVLTADCAPVLMADLKAGVIAAVHAGWKGAKGGIIESAIDAMASLGSKASDVVAAIGPAISPAAYEVGPEFKAAFLSDSEDNEQYFLQQREEARPRFNLRAYVKDRLLRQGVAQIAEIDVCTYENESILFSHRRSVHRGEADYGRQISAILIR